MGCTAWIWIVDTPTTLSFSCRIQQREKMKAEFLGLFIWCRTARQHHEASNALETNPFQSQCCQHTLGLFAVVFGKLGTRIASDLCRRLCLLHRHRWLAFARTVLLLSTQLAFRIGGRVMHLRKNGRKTRDFFIWQHDNLTTWHWRTEEAS